MCGRVSQKFAWEELAELLDLTGQPASLEVRYNVAPGQDVAAVRLDEYGRRSLVYLHWGLIPYWAKHQRVASNLINARVETVRNKHSFREAFRKRRCLVPVDGFYEWTDSLRGRQPWRIARMDRGVFALAGLWESWRVPEDAALSGVLRNRRHGDEIETMAILTTAASPFMKRRHDRMPAILAKDDFQTWLECGKVELAPFTEDVLEAFRVSRSVNNSHFDGPVCAERLEESR